MKYADLLGPPTVAEAVEKLRAQLSAEDLDRIAGMPRDELIMLHFGLGQGIRNSFGLWNEDSPLRRATQKDDADDAAMVIIEALWAALQARQGAK